MECTAQREALLFPLAGGRQGLLLFCFFVLLFTLFTPIKFYFYPFDALGVLFGACCSLAFLSEGFFDLLSLSLNFSLIPSMRSGRAGPLLSAPAESRQRQAQGSFTPLRIPGPKWGAGRPPLETPKSSLARQTWPNSSPLARLELRCRWGKRERVRARHGRRTSTASGLGALPPCPRPPLANLFLPLRSPKGKVLPVMRARAWDNVRCGFAGNASANLPEAPAAKRLGVPSLPSRGCAEGTLARPQGGIPKGGAALFGQSLPTFCWPESRGLARPERVEGIN